MSGEHGQDSWIDWFKERFGDDLKGHNRQKWIYHHELFHLIHRRLGSGAKLIECGSGSGVYAATLSLFGYDVTGVDLDPKMVEFATENAAELGATQVRFEEGSVLEMEKHYGQYDLAYSLGVIEHFSDEEAAEILRQKSRCAPNVLVVVPTKYVWEKEVATTTIRFERYTVSRLRRVVRAAGLQIEEQVGFCAGDRVGRAVELLCPPLLQRYLFPHFTSTIGIWARRP